MCWLCREKQANEQGQSETALWLCFGVPREQVGWVQKSRFCGFSGSIMPEQKKIDSWRITLEKMALTLAKLWEFVCSPGNFLFTKMAQGIEFAYCSCVQNPVAYMQEGRICPWMLSNLSFPETNMQRIHFPHFLLVRARFILCFGSVMLSEHKWPRNFMNFIVH